MTFEKRVGNLDQLEPTGKANISIMIFVGPR